jgi:hypothetical protein
MGENSFAFNSTTDRNFQIIFLPTNYHFSCALVLKNGFSISKIKGRERGKLILIARYKNLFHFVIFKFRLKLNRKRCVYTSRLSFKTFSTISILFY